MLKQKQISAFSFLLNRKYAKLPNLNIYFVEEFERIGDHSNS